MIQCSTIYICWPITILETIEPSGAESLLGGAVVSVWGHFHIAWNLMFILMRITHRVQPCDVEGLWLSNLSKDFIWWELQAIDGMCLDHTVCPLGPIHCSKQPLENTLHIMFILPFSTSSNTLHIIFNQNKAILCRAIGYPTTKVSHVLSMLLLHAQRLPSSSNIVIRSMEEPHRQLSQPSIQGAPTRRSKSFQSMPG